MNEKRGKEKKKRRGGGKGCGEGKIRGELGWRKYEHSWQHIYNLLLTLFPFKSNKRKLPLREEW